MLAYEAPFRYRSYYYDSEISMYYLNTRYYDAKMHRFINADEVSYLGANGDLQAFNLYAYCSNNPVMYFDPCGTLAQEFIISSWWITQVDGPLPVMDILFGALAITLVAVDIAVQEGALDLPKVDTKEKDIAIPKTKKDENGETLIYRYGEHLYPTISDVYVFDPEILVGVSFSLNKPKQGITYYVTTIEKLNESGIFVAINDHGKHVTVSPTGVYGDILNWYYDKEYHQYTVSLMLLCEKVN